MDLLPGQVAGIEPFGHRVSFQSLPRYSAYVYGIMRA